MKLRKILGKSSGAGETQRINNEGEQGEENGVDKSRRKFLGTLGKVLVVGAGLVALGGGSGALYNTLKEDDLDEEAIKEAEENLERHGVTIYDFLLFANFSSAVYNLAQGEKSYIKMGQGLEYLYNKIPYSQEVSQYFGKFSEGKLRFLQDLYDGAKELIGHDIPHLDHEFPHAELAMGLFLNLLYASQGEHEKERVIHGLKETGIGVGLLVFSTMVGKGIRPAQPTAEEVRRDFETTKTIDTIRNTGDLVQDCKETVDGICNAIGCQLLGVPFTQLPKTAYGSARSIGATMKQVLHLTQSLGSQLEGKPISDIESTLPSIENKVIRKILQTIINEDKKNNEEENNDRIFTSKMVEQFVTTYSNRINIGLMSPSMDIGQAAIGDLAPALIGAYQSFGILEALKTSAANFPYSLLSMFSETFFMTSQRIGVPLKKLATKENLKKMILDVVHTWVNLGKSILLAEQNQNGSSYNGSSILQDSRNIINGLFVYWTETGADKLAAQIMDKLIKEDNDLEDALNTMQNKERGSLKQQGVTVEQTGKLSSIMQIFSIPAEEIEKAVDKGKSAQEIIAQYPDEKILAAGNLDDLYDSIKQKMRQEGKDETEIEKLTKVIPEVQKDIEKFISEVQGLSPGKNFIENFSKIKAFQNKKTNPLRMLTFDYWKEAVGAEIAETAFVVFLQGIHGVGLLPIFSSFMNSNDLLIFTKYTGFSMVADNRLAQMTCAKEMATKKLGDIADSEVAKQVAGEGMNENIEAIKKQYGFNYNTNKNVIENFTDLANQLCNNRKESSLSVTKNELDDIYKKFCEIKSQSVIAGVGGGGESTIGNAPHFSAIIDELKGYMSLTASLKDMINFPVQHIRRLAFGYVRGKYGAPTIETSLFKNPFIAIAESTGVEIVE